MKSQKDAYSLFSPGWPCDKAEWAETVLSLGAAIILVMSVVFSFLCFFGG